MPLEVYTSRISYGWPDRLDCTRKSGTDGLFLAPSWAILKPALASMKTDLEEWNFYANEGAWSCGEAAKRRLDDTWRKYVKAYKSEMATSQKEHADRWEWLLGLERIVLCCYCTSTHYCHRRLLRADILPGLGAKDCGEL